MFDDHSFRRYAAWGALASVPLAIASNVLAVAAVDFDLATFADPRALLSVGARGATLWRAAMLLALFGYYLLVAPMFGLLGRHWRVRGDAGRALGAAGYAYVLAGAIGAAVLAAALPPVINAYAAEPAQRAMVATVFDTVSNVVYVGLWQTLGALLAGIAWTGFGLMLRTDRPALAALTLTLGTASLLEAAATIAGFDRVTLVGVSLHIVLAPVWALWSGVDALESRKAAPVPLPAMAVIG